MKPRSITVELLAEACELPIVVLWKLSGNSSTMFMPECKRRIGKKYRPINPPKAEYKKYLRKLHRFLQKSIDWPPTTHGGIRKSSIFTSANQHHGRRFVVTRDVKEAFPSITTDALRKSLRKLGFRSDVAKILSGLMTLDGKVPHGSPISTDAINLFLFSMDMELDDQCHVLRECSYTRYVDDCTISTNDRSSVAPLEELLDRSIERTGLHVNQAKKRLNGCQGPEGKKMVHNLVVSHPWGVSISPEQGERANKVAMKYLMACQRVQPSSLEAVARIRAQLTGWICHFQQAKVSPVGRLRQLRDVGDRRVNKKLEKERVFLCGRKWWSLQGRKGARSISKQWMKVRESNSDGLANAA